MCKDTDRCEKCRKRLVERSWRIFSVKTGDDELLRFESVEYPEFPDQPPGVPFAASPIAGLWCRPCSRLRSQALNVGVRDWVRITRNLLELGFEMGSGVVR